MNDSRPQIPLRQIFLHDPNGIRLELNYRDAPLVPESRRPLTPESEIAPDHGDCARRDSVPGAHHGRPLARTVLSAR